MRNWQQRTYLFPSHCLPSLLTINLAVNNLPQMILDSRCDKMRHPKTVWAGTQGLNTTDGESVHVSIFAEPWIFPPLTVHNAFL